jgi:hypothetical protein
VRVEHGGVTYRWPAQVDRVESAVDSGTRTFNIVVRVDAPGARGTPLSGPADAAPPLLVGMYATVEIEGRRQGRYAVVPRRAVRDGSTLWLVGADDVVSIRPVRLLSETGNQATVVADGVAEGARVVVSDLRIVTEGMPVRVVQDGATPPAGTAGAPQSKSPPQARAGTTGDPAKPSGVGAKVRSTQ